VTPFSRFRSQLSGNTGGQHDTLRPSFHDANWREHAEIKTIARMPCSYTSCFAGGKVAPRSWNATGPALR